MKKINHWFKKRKQKYSRWYMNISDALFSKKMFAYVFYRLRYFLIIQFLEAILLFVEYLFVAKYLSHKLLFSYLIFRITTLFLSGAWWGFLEVLRSKIRRVFSRVVSPRVIQYVQLQITVWFLFTIGLSIILVLITFLYFTWQGKFSGLDAAFDWYVVFAIYQLICYMLVRTIYSGVYAIVRIWRPLWVSLLPSAGGLIIIAVTWRWLGVYSFPVSMIISVSLMNIFLVRYILMAYNKQGLIPFRKITVIEFKKTLRDSLCWEAVGGFLSNGAIQLQFLSLILVLDFSWPKTSSLSIVALFYILFPQLDAAFNWSRLTYFDGKRFLKQSRQFFIKRINTAFLIVGLLVSFLFWLLAVVLISFVGGRVSFLPMLEHFPIFMLTAALIYLQLQLFVKRRYYNILLSGAVLMLGFWLKMVVTTTMINDLDVSLFLFVAIALTFIPLPVLADIKYLKTPRDFFEWAAELKLTDKAMTIVSIQLSNEANVRTGMQLVDRVCQFLPEDAELTFLAGRHFFIKTSRPRSEISEQEKVLFSVLHAKYFRSILFFESTSGVGVLRKLITQHPWFHQFSQLNYRYWQERFQTTFSNATHFEYPKFKQTGHQLSKRNIRAALFALEDAEKQPLMLGQVRNVSCYYEYYHSKLTKIIIVPSKRYSAKKLLKWKKYFFVKNLYDLMSSDAESMASFYQFLSIPKSWLASRKRHKPVD